MRGLRRRKWLATIAVPLVLVALPGMAGADDTSQYRYQLVAKAVPDECFNGVGVAYPPGPPCAVGQPKVNQAYVWGLAQVHNKVWFGTGANVACLVSGFTLDVTDPILNDDFVCEYGQSQAAKANPDLLPALGDQRPPQLMYYDKKNHHLVDESGVVDAASPADKARRAATIGIRAGGAFNGVVLFGGPNLNPNGGVNLFAFDGDSGRYLGSTELTNYGNIRHFL
ncbi:MAG: hypothetical protein J2P15_20840, partial [Micromonosporaceae bacterium]|nr:hypothetical protein [Micromonosporaceae bacterium]